MPPKSFPHERLSLWMDWFSIYWDLLDEDQKKSYLLSMWDTNELPPNHTAEDMSEKEIQAFKIHQGKTIRKYRSQINMGAEDLATILGRTKGYISLVESGDRSLPVIDTYRVSKVLNIPLKELFDIKL